MSIRQFLSELKRRQVYRAVIVYATLAWALLEGADIVLPRLGFEDESVTLVLILVILGFPIALYLAWIYDITPDGIFRTPPLSPGTKHQFSWSRIVEFVVIGSLVGVVGYLYVDRLSLQEKLAQQESVSMQSRDQARLPVVNPEQYRAIAVLPFADMSESGDQGWFAEGIAEELLHALANIKDLRVMARTSSFAFKDTDKTIAEIADILGVQAVLEGSVRRAGDRLRITAQLIDARSGYHIWSESYERKATDIFQVQDEIAKSIVATLRLEFGANKNRSLIPVKTKKLEAYNAFIRGRASLDWANPDDLKESIENLEMAVALDPDYAEAWGYLAWAHTLTALWQSTEVASAPTTTAYQNALSLDPEQSEALAAKAWMALLLEWDWETAGRLYRRSLASKENPNAMFGYGMFYLPIIDEMQLAIGLLREAEQLDPLHAGYKANIAFLHIWTGDLQAAIEKAKEALAINPEHVFGQMALLEAYTANGKCNTVLEILDSLPGALKMEPRILGRAGVCHALLGEEERAREIYEHVKTTTPYYYANMQAAALAMNLGEVEDAMDILEGEIDKHAWTSPFIRIYFGRNVLLKDNPRFLSMLRRIGLDDHSIAQRREKVGH